MPGGKSSPSLSISVDATSCFPEKGTVSASSKPESAPSSRLTSLVSSSSVGIYSLSQGREIQPAGSDNPVVHLVFHPNYHVVAEVVQRRGAFLPGRPYKTHAYLAA